MYRLEEFRPGPYVEWEKPADDRRYVLGADSGSGKTDGDFSAAVVVEASTGDQVARWRGKLEPMDFTRVLIAIGYRWAGRAAAAMVVPEINHHGIAMIEGLRLAEYPSIYMRQSWDRVEAKFSSQIGWTTSQKSRPILIQRARTALAGDCRIPDLVLLDECTTFVRVVNRDGQYMREDHQPGAHDDVLFAWMLALEGRHLLIETEEADPVSRTASPVARGEHDWVWEKMRRDAASREQESGDFEAALAIEHDDGEADEWPF